MTQYDTTGTSGQADCEFAARVSAYHDGELPEGEAREVARHVAGCPACARQLAFFGKVSDTFGAAPVHHLDADGRQRLEELTEELQAEQRRIKPADVRWVRRLTAAAAILFVVAAGKVIYDQKSIGSNPVPVTPAHHLADPVAPSPEPVSDGRSATKAPAVTPADFVAPPGTNGAIRPNAPATGQSANP